MIKLIVCIFLHVQFWNTIHLDRLINECKEYKCSFYEFITDAFRLTVVNFFREFYKLRLNAYIYKLLLAAIAVGKLVYFTENVVHVLFILS